MSRFIAIVCGRRAGRGYQEPPCRYFRWLMAVPICLVLSACSLESPSSKDVDRASTVPARIVAMESNQVARPDDRVEVLARACRFLWSQQADDGGWHSTTYALTRSGQSLTPFVLHALLDVPADVCTSPVGAVERALDFIRQHVDDEGALGRADPEVLDYPNYATAYGLMCLRRHGDVRDEPLIARMRDYLVRAQYQSANGFETSSPAFGGWGFNAAASAGLTGHMDLAHTRRVLDALHAAGAVDSRLLERAERFLQFVQRHPDDARPQPPFETAQAGHELEVPYDGGFYFSPIVWAANKGRTAEIPGTNRRYFRSYSTATCDGVLALLAAGVAGDDDRVATARRWLEDHHSLDYVEGIPRQHPEPWSDAVMFYHHAVRAEVYDALGGPEGWRDEITARLAERQETDGSFANMKSHLMKEDDPLVATPLALIALSRALSSEARRPFCHTAEQFVRAAGATE